MKKVAIAACMIMFLSACGTSIGPGNKEDVDDKIEQQNYRGNDLNRPYDRDKGLDKEQFNDQNLNDRNNNNLNRRQINDNLEPNRNDGLEPDVNNDMDRNLVQ